MSTLEINTNETSDWKLYPNSADFSGIAQNFCDRPIYLYVVATGEVPSEEKGILLKGGVGEYLPVSIAENEELQYKPVAKGPVSMRLG